MFYFLSKSYFLYKINKNCQQLLFLSIFSKPVHIMFFFSYRQMIQDDHFRERISELNSDPTGLGLPAGTRDMCYQHLQSEEDRKFQAIASREKREIEKRRKGRKKQKNPKFSNTAETSFIEGSGLIPSASLYEDTISRNSEDGTSKYPASCSMTELPHGESKGVCTFEFFEVKFFLLFSFHRDLTQ